jgi:hypothetical protein
MSFAAKQKEILSMPAQTQKPAITLSALRSDLALVVFLIAFDVVARLLPHAYGFLPIAASGLFAARVLRIPALAIVVPIVAMSISSWLAFGHDDWRVALIVYAAISIPAIVGILSRGRLGVVGTVAVMLPCSLAFFALSNFAVWAFSGMYSLDLAGLIQCYVAALPFLQYTVAGDMFWTAVLFGGYWAIQHVPALARR